MTDKQCTVCGMHLVLMKWKHTLKVTKQQTHHASFMSFDISIKKSTTEGNASKIWFNSPLYYFIIHFMTDWQCTICGMRLVLMKWKHTLLKSQNDRLTVLPLWLMTTYHFDISINTTKGEPMKISHILISHNFHWHGWSILFRVIMEGFLHCFPEQGRQAAHKKFVSINRKL
jgi:hypothetical protein